MDHGLKIGLCLISFEIGAISVRKSSRTMCTVTSKDGTRLGLAGRPLITQHSQHPTQRGWPEAVPAKENAAQGGVGRGSGSHEQYRLRVG
jgi:hypothetical protein